MLRRKRQRNLNKLGIGGFVVRQRQVTAKSLPDDDGDGSLLGGLFISIYNLYMFSPFTQI